MKAFVFEGLTEKVAEQLRPFQGRTIRAFIYVDEPVGFSQRSREEWNRDFQDMISQAVHNDQPADVSREAMYLPDEP